MTASGSENVVHAGYQRSICRNREKSEHLVLADQIEVENSNFCYAVGTR